MTDAIRPEPAAAHAGSAAHAEPTRLREAACQFESLLIAQMLKTMRESGSGWLGTSDEDDQAGATATEVAEEQFAQAMARQGGLGLARLVVSGVAAEVTRTKASPAPAHIPAGPAV
jgi:Rod binding domain-containing protein